MGAFEYRQAEEIRDAFAVYGVEYLFIGKSGAILLGFPDTTQDADLFVRKSPDNGLAVVKALRELGFAVSKTQASEIERERRQISSIRTTASGRWLSRSSATAATLLSGENSEIDLMNSGVT